MRDAQATMQRIGTQLINERKATILQDLPKTNVPISRDILSVLGAYPSLHVPSVLPYL